MDTNQPTKPNKGMLLPAVVDIPECSVCLEDITEKEHEPLCSCSHAFCRPCLTGWVDALERQQCAAPTRPACPTCRQPMNDWDMIRIVGRPFRLPPPVIPPSDEEDALFRDYLEEQGARSCPNCGVWILRSDGCNAMTCRCKTKFCYGCGKTQCKCGDDGDYNDYNYPDDYSHDDWAAYWACCTCDECVKVPEYNEQFDPFFCMEGLKRTEKSRFGVGDDAATKKRSANKDKQKRKTKTVNRKDRQRTKDRTERIDDLVCGINEAFQKAKNLNLHKFKIFIDQTSKKLSNGDVGVAKFCGDAMCALWETERTGKTQDNFPTRWGGTIVYTEDYIACLDLATLHHLEYGSFVEDVLIPEKRGEAAIAGENAEMINKQHGTKNRHKKKKSRKVKKVNRSAKKKQFHLDLIHKE